MKKIQAFVQTYMKWIIGALIVVGGIVIISLVTGSETTTDEIFTVEHTTVTQSVQVTGQVEAQAEVDLSFSATGKVDRIVAQEGDYVTRGALLAKLDTAGLYADLQRAKAELNIQELEQSSQLTSVDNDATNLDVVTEQQDSNVESAYRTLLSTGLIAVPRKETYTQTAPVISGLYTGAEGEYRIRIVRDRVNDVHMTVRSFGIENWEGDAAANKAVPMGTQGLYISFPDDVESYDDTMWYITIPNVKSSEYVANLAAYNDAVKARRVAIEQASATFEESTVTTPIRNAQIQKAQAEVARIQADIVDRIIRAPFNGLITNQAVEEGEIVTSGTSAISMISDGVFNIRAQVPEIDIAKLSVGDKASVQLDAFTQGDLLEATIVHIDPAATKVDGVPVYEITLEFTQEDERIRSGMTADVTIITEEHTDVLAVPKRFISDGYVHRLTDNDTFETVPVTTGMSGDASLTIITEGVQDGDRLYRSMSK